MNHTQQCWWKHWCQDHVAWRAIWCQVAKLGLCLYKLCVPLSYLSHYLPYPNCTKMLIVHFLGWSLLCSAQDPVFSFLWCLANWARILFEGQRRWCYLDPVVPGIIWAILVVFRDLLGYNYWCFRTSRAVLGDGWWTIWCWGLNIQTIYLNFFIIYLILWFCSLKD